MFTAIEALERAGATTVDANLVMLALGATLGIILDIWVQGPFVLYTRESQVFLHEQGADERPRSAVAS